MVFINGRFSSSLQGAAPEEMEYWSAIKSKVGPLLWMLVLCTVFSLLFFLPPPFSSTVTAAKEALSRSSLLSPVSNLTIQMVQSPPKPSGSEEALAIQKASPTINGVNATSTTPKLLTSDGVEGECDISVGKWEEDPSGPIYTNLTCRTLPDDRNCVKYGKDQSFLWWRWRPAGCELPRFDPKEFLDIVKGKKMAFIGDSLARNQMESLLCLLSQAETPKDISIEPYGRYRTWLFPSHNFTLMVMWTEFLVQAEERLINGTPSGSFDLNLDRLNTHWTEKLPGLDYAILSGGNWFFRRNYLHQNGKLLGCVNCMEPTVTDLGMPFAIRRTLRAALEFISSSSCKGCQGRLMTFLRTYSGSHFEHGSWFSGGYCNRTHPLEEREIFNMEEMAMEIRSIQLEEIERVIRGERDRRLFGVLDVTKAMMFRADGHPEKRWTYGKKVNDCLHWCLPGPIDMWSELLLATLMKKIFRH